MAAHRISADDVIDCAERLLHADGLRGLSTRRLATELGVSRQVVYTHFAGMHGVFEQLHLRSGQYLTRAVQGLDAPSGSDDKLCDGAQAYVDYARTKPELFELTFGAPVATYVPSEATTATLQSIFRVEIAGLIREWHDANRIELPGTSLLDRTRVFWSSTHGLVTLERARHASRDETDRLVRLLTTSLLDGWRSEARETLSRGASKRR